jgi:hypothetical protein
MLPAFLTLPLAPGALAMTMLAEPLAGKLAGVLLDA